MSRKRKAVTHGFTNSGFVDFLDRPICSTCSQIAKHVRHGWPSTPDGAREFDDRVLGERSS